jgi:hypothetical protein
MNPNHENVCNNLSVSVLIAKKPKEQDLSW